MRFFNQLIRIFLLKKGMRARSGTMEAVKRSDFDLMLGKYLITGKSRDFQQYLIPGMYVYSTVYTSNTSS